MVNSINDQAKKAVTNEHLGIDPVTDSEAMGERMDLKATPMNETTLKQWTESFGKPKHERHNC